MPCSDGNLAVPQAQQHLLGSIYRDAAIDCNERITQTITFGDFNYTIVPQEPNTSLAIEESVTNQTDIRVPLIIAVENYPDFTYNLEITLPPPYTRVLVDEDELIADPTDGFQDTVTTRVNEAVQRAIEPLMNRIFDYTKNAAQ